MLYRVTIQALAVFPFVAVAGCVQPEETPFAEFRMDVKRCAEIRRLAVLPFTDGPGRQAENSGNSVAGFVLGSFAQSGRYVLVERSEARRLMDELDLQAADLIDPGTAARIGRLVGVDAVVTGSVSQYDYDKTVVYVWIIPVIMWKYRVGATVRIIDVDGGRIIYCNSASGSSGSTYTKAGRRAMAKIFEPLFTQVKAATAG